MEHLSLKFSFLLKNLQKLINKINLLVSTVRENYLISSSPEIKSL